MAHRANERGRAGLGIASLVELRLDVEHPALDTGRDSGLDRRDVPIAVVEVAPERASDHRREDDRLVALGRGPRRNRPANPERGRRLRERAGGQRGGRVRRWCVGALRPQLDRRALASLVRWPGAARFDVRQEGPLRLERTRAAHRDHAGVGPVVRPGEGARISQGQSSQRLFGADDRPRVRVTRGENLLGQEPERAALRPGLGAAMHLGADDLELVVERLRVDRRKGIVEDLREDGGHRLEVLRGAERVERRRVPRGHRVAVAGSERRQPGHARHTITALLQREMLDQVREPRVVRGLVRGARAHAQDDAARAEVGRNLEDCLEPARLCGGRYRISKRPHGGHGHGRSDAGHEDERSKTTMTHHGPTSRVRRG
jgi:hypothetical protein